MPVSSTSNLIIALFPLVCKSYLREEAGRIVMLHKEWLGMTWKKYSKEAHRALGSLYTSDERFKHYYDQEVPGCAEFLEQAILCTIDGQ